MQNDPQDIQSSERSSLGPIEAPQPCKALARCDRHPSVHRSAPLKLHQTADDLLLSLSSSERSSLGPIEAQNELRRSRLG